MSQPLLRLLNTPSPSLLIALALGLSACGSGGSPGDDDDDDMVGDDDDAEVDPGDFDSTETVGGDWTCVGDEQILAAGTSGDLQGFVEDFQDETPVAGAQIRIWLDNDPTGSVESALEATTDNNGQFSISASEGIMSCSPFAARVWTEFDPPETYQTFQNNIILSGSSPFSETLNSVSYSTYQLLPLTVGVEPEAGKGIAAGRVTDCNGDPVSGAEASVGTVDWASGTITEAEGYAMRYFRDDEPAHDQLNISDDGLFGGMNVPPGEVWSLLIWGIPQDESHCHMTEDGSTVIRPDSNEAYCLLGLSSITVQPDSVNIANIELNRVPEGCEASP